MTKASVRFIVEEEKCIQATAALKSEMFQDYIFPEGHMLLQFQINLSILIDCLNMYGAAAQDTALHMRYPGVESTLVLELTEGDVVTDCKIRTRPADDTLDMHFRDSPVQSKIILRSGALKECISEMEWLGDTLFFCAEPEEGFTIKCSGSAGSNQIDIPRDSEAYYLFECSTSHSNSYRLSHIHHCIKALTQSERTCIRMNQQGVLSLQHMLKTDATRYTIVEFFICPVDDENQDPAEED